MRQPLQDKPIGICPYSRSGNYHNKYQVAVTEIHKHRPRASACKRPTYTEYGATYDVPHPVFGLVGKCDGCAGDVFKLEFFDERCAYCAEHHSCANDAVHVERLESKHLLNAVPGDGFAFGHDDAEEDAGEYEFECFHKFLISCFGLAQNEGQQYECGEKTSDEKSDHSDQ